MLSAGEASGDRLGAGLARALLRRRPQLELIGMGGERMAEAGVRLVQDASEVAVVGLFEVLRHYPALRRAMDRLVRLLDEQRPALLIPVDYPEFNLRLAARARTAQVPVVYYVSPQLWAWRSGRVRGIKKLVRRVMVLFPFETDVYEQAGVPVSFVGNPVGEPPAGVPDRDAILAAAGLDPARETIALMPGSRRGEIARQLPRLLAAASILEEARDDLQFILPLAPGLDREWLVDLASGQAPRRMQIHHGDYPALLSICAAGVVAAGTATLDAAVAGMPMIVVYRMNSFSYLLGRIMVNVEHASLPNLVAGKEIVPELIQGDFTVERVVALLQDYLDRPEHAARVRADLAAVRDSLEGAGASERAADVVLAELDRVLAGSRSE